MEGGECAICGNNADSKPFLQAWVAGFHFQYRRCKSCGLVFLNPRPGVQEIGQFYDEEYYGGGRQKFRDWIETLRLYFARRRASRMKRFFPGGGRALDVGCGQGTFLELLRKEGWEVQGTERSPDSACRARLSGLPVSVGEVQRGQFPDHSLDLVTLWQVIEHLYDPAVLMRRIHPMLRNGGMVAISTPNIESLQARVFREKWFHLDPPRHLYLFSPQTLERLMNREGFRLVALNHLSWEQNPYGWLQSFLNRMGSANGSLYAYLKNLPPSRDPKGSLSGKNLLLAAGLLPVCFLLPLILERSGRGGTFEAYFEKDT